MIADGNSVTPVVHNLWLCVLMPRTTLSFPQQTSLSTAAHK